MDKEEAKGLTVKLEDQPELETVLNDILDIARQGGKRVIGDGFTAFVTENDNDYIISASPQGEAGVAAVSKNQPFQLLTSKPSHVLDPDPEITLADGEFVLWIQDGLVNNVIPSNMNDYEIVSTSKLVLLKLNINSTAEFGVDLTSAEIVLDSYDTPTLTDDPYPAPSAGFQGLPPVVYLKIGAVIVAGTGSEAKVNYVQYGTGNIQVTSEVSSVTTDGMGTYFRRQLKVSRY